MKFKKMNNKSNDHNYRPFYNCIYIFLLGIIPICVIIVLIINLGSVESSNNNQILHNNNNNNNINNNSFISLKKNSNFLYQNSKFIKELNLEQANDIIYAKNKKSPSMIIFYATWCSHCVHYVPIYNRIAKANSNRNLSFYSINCVEFGSFCKSSEIEGFPTILSFYISSDEKSMNSKGKKLNTKESNMMEYLNDYVSIVNSNNYKKSNNEKLLIADKDEFESWLLLAHNSLARTTTPLSRVEDGISSLNFLLSEEIPNQIMTEQKKKSIENILDVIVKLLPNKYKNLYNDILLWVKSISTINVLVDDWKKEVTNRILNFDLGDNNSIKKLSIKWHVCGIEKGNRISEVDSSRGYSCGLWMLMHFMTTAAETSNIQNINGIIINTTVTAPVVVDTIVTIVNELFGCLSCREHFMKSYTACNYNVCNINNNDYELLQLWLFHTHNSVTSRIFSETSSNFKSFLRSNKFSYVITDLIWPNALLCPTCHNNNNNNGENILSSGSLINDFRKVSKSNKDQELRDINTTSFSLWKNINVITFLKKSYVVD
jgi:thiol-disulfide isomerase/thioredoxin